MKPRKTLGAALLLLLGLAACSQSPTFRTTGSLRILDSEPPLARCTLRAGDFFILKGNDFGTAEAWSNGTNYLILPEGLPAPVELTRERDPATLQARVPAGAVSGTAWLHVEGVGDAEFEVRIQGGPAPALVPPECRPPDPNGSGSKTPPGSWRRS